MDTATAAGALACLGVAIWLLVLALVSAPDGWSYAAWSLAADAASFALLGWSLARRRPRG